MRTSSVEPRSASEAAAKSAPDAAIEVAVVERWADVEALAPEWHRLLQQIPSASAFLTWEWSQSWWEAFGGRSTPWVIVIRRNGDIAAIVPLRLQRGSFGMRRVSFLADGTGDSDGLDLLSRPGEEALVVEVAAGWLQAHREQWDVLELNTLPAESPNVALWEQAARRRGWRVRRREFPHLVVPLAGTWEEFRRQVEVAQEQHGLAADSSGPAAAATRRRRLEREFKVEFAACPTETELPVSLDELFRLHGLRWTFNAGRGVFDDARRDFFRRVASRFLAKGWLDLRLMKLNGTAAAAYFGLRYGGTYSFLQSGFDPAYARYSPGWVLTDSIMREMIAAGMKEYDFLGGDDRYKYRWGPQRRSYVYLTVVRPHSLGGTWEVSKVTLEGLVAAVRHLAPAPLRRALRRAWFRMRNMQER